MSTKLLSVEITFEISVGIRVAPGTSTHPTGACDKLLFFYKIEPTPAPAQVVVRVGCLYIEVYTSVLPHLYKHKYVFCKIFSWKYKHPYPTGILLQVRVLVGAASLVCTKFRGSLLASILLIFRESLSLGRVAALGTGAATSGSDKEAGWGANFVSARNKT